MLVELLKNSNTQFFTAPNVYDIPKADKLLLDKSPKYSFGGKTELQIKSDTPG